ncbi:MAG TPA: hypothetical protein VK501_07610 [Baekduia sp.]|uniref:hypothetical protein n=1 Tax=Baekduia sp. TaxID=2600305 RepID=UPI002B843452|nr:hypothetical protein [Baekduia sp.]HMJ33769.1 hypothetical protein [Baekduia sp.]
MKRYAVLTAAAGLLIGAAAIGLPAEAQKPTRAEANAALIAKSAQLKERPAPADLNAGPYLQTYTEIKAYADQFAATLPLPEADSLDDVGLVAAADQGGTSASLLEFVILNNLRCDWYNAALDDPDAADVARTIATDVPRWGVFKSSEIAGEIAQRSARVADGISAGDLSALKAEVAGPNCNPLAAVRKATQ